MKASNLRFTEFVRVNDQQFKVPVFQRTYDWKADDHCAKFWRDVLRAGRGEVRQHFLGALVKIPARDDEEDFRRWLVVDGQQRLTTLLLLLVALRDHVRQASGDSAGKFSAEQIDHNYLTNFDLRGQDRYRLVLRGSDHDALRQLIDGPERPQGLSVGIESAYSFFSQRIPDTDPDLVMRGLHKLSIVDVELDWAVDDPQATFESLNATGLELTKADLIRNRILMRLPDEEQTAMYNQYWREIEDRFRGGNRRVFDNFARDYIDMKGRREKQTRTDEIYPTFREFWQEQRQHVDLEPALSDIRRHARYYASVRIGPDSATDREHRYQRIRALRAAPAITMMRLLECREQEGTLDEHELLNALDLIESYLVRRLVCGLSTRAYDKVFAYLTSRVGNREPLIDLKVALRLRPEGCAFPSNGEFRRALQEDSMYGRPVCKFLLDRFENHDRKEQVNTAKLTIEHVLPRSKNLSEDWKNMLGHEDWERVQDTYMHRLGNLTLTAYNAEYSNRPFQEKKTMKGGFAQSPLRLNEFIREQAEWTVEVMERRAKRLSEVATSIWPDLEVDQSRVEAAELSEKQKRAARRSVSDIIVAEPVRPLLRQFRQRVHALGSDVVEIFEPRTISCHRLRYFLEIVPRKRSLLLLLALPYVQAEDPSERKKDLRDWKFVPHAKYKEDSQTCLEVPVDDHVALDDALHLIRQAYDAAG